MRKQVADYYIKTLTGSDYIRLSDAMPEEDATNSDFIRSMAEFSAVAIVNEAGQPIYKTAQEWLDNIKFDILTECGNAVLDILTEKAVESKTDVDEAVKN